MHLRATVKTVARGFVKDSMHYRPRPCGLGRKCIETSTAPRAIEKTVASIKHEIVVLLPYQCKNKFTSCKEAPLTSDVS